MRSNLLTWLLSCLASAVLTAGVLFLSASEFGAQTRTSLTRFVESQIQSILRRQLPLQPNLHIYEIRSTTFQAMGAATITPEHWALLLHRLGQHKPRALLIEAVLDFQSSNASLDPLSNALKSQNFPVLLGARIQAGNATGDAREDLTAFFEKSFQIRKWQRTGDPLPHWIEASSQHMPQVFLPHPAIRKQATQVGYVGADRQGFVEPFQRLGDFWFLPHLALTPADKLEITHDSLLIDGRDDIINYAGKIAVEQPSLRTLRERTMPFELLWQDLVVDQKAELGPSPVILILDGYDTRWQRNPNHPEALTTVGLVNHVLSGRWTKQAAHEKRWIILASALATILALTLSLPWLRMVSIFGLIPIVSLGIFLFIVLRLSIPWLYPSLGFWLVCSAIYSLRKALGHPSDEPEHVYVESAPLTFIDDDDHDLRAQSSQRRR